MERINKNIRRKNGLRIPNMIPKQNQIVNHNKQRQKYQKQFNKYKIINIKQKMKLYWNIQIHQWQK